MSIATVFVSYSRKDEVWKDRLVAQLNVAKFQGMFATWNDIDDIETGGEWLKSIEEAMDAAKIAVFLISDDFLNSKFIAEHEVPRLMKRFKENSISILPIFLRPCDYKAVHWLAPLQLWPSNRALSAGNDYQIDADLAVFAKKIRDLMNRSARPTQKWVPLAPDRVSVGDLPFTRRELFGRDEELQQLDDAWEDPHTNVVSLVASGGVGKSSVVNRWLGKMALDYYRAAELVYAWSFYKQGTTQRVVSSDLFMTKALEWFQDPDPKKGTPLEKGERLTSLVQQRRTLLVLDGLEPLQYPPGIREGELKDEALSKFLRALALHNPGLCIISTRLKVTDLEQFKTTTQRIELGNLSPQAGAELLRELKVDGEQKELEDASRDFDGHPLALTLLGSALTELFGGNVERRREVRHLEKDQRFGEHAFRVMASYEKWLGAVPALSILSMVGLFDRPADPAALASLRAGPVVPGLNDDPGQRRWWKTMLCRLGLRKWELMPDEVWKPAVARLRRLNLLAQQRSHEPDNCETIDTHPLIREHFGNQLQQRWPAAWVESNRRLFEHFKGRTDYRPDSLDALELLFRAVAHGCDAGRYEDAFEDVYWQRIVRESVTSPPATVAHPRYFSTDEHGAFGDDLAAASRFFHSSSDHPRWDQPLPQLTKLQQARLQGAAGWDLRGLGKMEEAIQAFRGSMERYEGLEMWEPANVSCAQIAQGHMNRGELGPALEYAERKHLLADQNHTTFWRTAGFVLRALIVFQMGPERQDEYESYCRTVGELGFAKDEGVGDAVDHMFIAFCWCDLLLGQVASPCTPTKGADGTRAQQVFKEIETRCDQVEEIARKEERPHPATEAAHLLRGRAYLLRGVYGGGGEADLTQAKALLDRALELLRTGPQELYLPGLRARAALHFFTENLDAAEEDLREALKVAKRGEMHLYEVDCQLQFVGLYLALKKNDKARKLLAQTGALVHKLGYHRRDQDIAELTMALEAASVEASPSLAVIE